MFVDFIDLYMGSNRLLIYGLINFGLQFLKNEIMGFEQSNHDHPLFLRRSCKGITLLLVFVNDILKSESDKFGIASLKIVIFSHEKSGIPCSCLWFGSYSTHSGISLST